MDNFSNERMEKKCRNQRNVRTGTSQFFLSSKVDLRGFGHIKQKEDIYCMMMEVDFTCLMKSWWYYVKEDLQFGPVPIGCTD